MCTSDEIQEWLKQMNCPLHIQNEELELLTTGGLGIIFTEVLRKIKSRVEVKTTLKSKIIDTVQTSFIYEEETIKNIPPVIQDILHNFVHYSNLKEQIRNEVYDEFDEEHLKHLEGRVKSYNDHLISEKDTNKYCEKVLALLRLQTEQLEDVTKILSRADNKLCDSTENDDTGAAKNEEVSLLEKLSISITEEPVRHMPEKSIIISSNKKRLLNENSDDLNIANSTVTSLNSTSINFEDNSFFLSKINNSGEASFVDETLNPKSAEHCTEAVKNESINLAKINPKKRLEYLLELRSTQESIIDVIVVDDYEETLNKEQSETVKPDENIVTVLETESSEQNLDNSSVFTEFSSDLHPDIQDAIVEVYDAQFRMLLSMKKELKEEIDINEMIVDPVDEIDFEGNQILSVEKDIVEYCTLMQNSQTEIENTAAKLSEIQDKINYFHESIYKENNISTDYLNDSFTNSSVSLVEDLINYVEQTDVLNNVIKFLTSLNHENEISEDESKSVKDDESNPGFTLVNEFNSELIQKLANYLQSSNDFYDNCPMPPKSSKDIDETDCYENILHTHNIIRHNLKDIEDTFKYVSKEIEFYKNSKMNVHLSLDTKYNGKTLQQYLQKYRELLNSLDHNTSE